MKFGYSFACVLLWLSAQWPPPLDDSCLYLTSVLQELQAHWRPREPQARNRLAQILNTIATEDDAQRQAADTELTQLRTMIGSLQDSLADFQKK